MTISPGDKLLMQVHYHQDPAVPPTPDSTAADLYFSPTTTREHAYVVWVGTPLFTIPANTKGYAVQFDVHRQRQLEAPRRRAAHAPARDQVRARTFRRRAATRAS